MGATKAVNAVALVRSGASQSLLDLDGVLRVMKDKRVVLERPNRGLGVFSGGWPLACCF